MTYPTKMCHSHTIDDKEVFIEWEQGDVVENHEQVIYYAMTGTGDDGKQYEATGSYCHGEFDEVFDIEEA